MRILPTLAMATTLAALAATATATATATGSVGAATAKPAVCRPAVIEHALIAAGKLTTTAVKEGEKADLVRCGDVTADGRKDAVFGVASGGTAGDVRFGVLEGRKDGSAGALVLFKQGYGIGLARASRRAFDVIQPHYGPKDPNCCPSSFRIRRYTWTGNGFKASKARKVKTAPRRFYRP